MARSEKTTVSIDGHRLQLSNLDKVLYPETGTTKGDVLEYLDEIAPVMLPHCQNRAVTRKRWPNGVGSDGSGQMFFQKDIGDGAPEWVETRSIRHSDHINNYPLANDKATLMWFGQLAALEIHVPQWQFGRGNEKRNPDRLVLDLDPGAGVSLRDCAAIAREARDILHDMGLSVVPVTSGSKGIHLYASLDGSQTSDQVSAVAHELARSLEADYPKEVISSMKKSAREGKVFIDWSQNNANKTTVAPYSLRGRVRPTVAAPRTWGELASPHLKQLEFREVLRRVQRRGDPMSEISSSESDNEPERDRLQVYRQKRSREKTPEPIPDASSRRAGGAAPTFVIQKHAARRLHYDFRLEHDGVLVSWALPKGVPTDPKTNHLAVPTEDHPLEYGSFEGSIPKGEYGAGTVEIWDAGTIEVEKWREGEVIATLYGKPDGGLGGSRTYALFRTKDDPDKPQWMIHLMDPHRGKQTSRRSSRSAPARQTSAHSTERPAASTSLRPMLATRGHPSDIASDDDEAWAFEMKWDGMRALISIAGENVSVWTRSGRDVTVSYPELIGVSDEVDAETCVLDCELVVMDAEGRPDFGRMQHRMNVTKPRDVTRAHREFPVTAMLFDVLDVNGQATTSLPYDQRRDVLADIVANPETGILVVPPAFDGEFDAAVTLSRERGLEGVMAKRRDSLYVPGDRSRDWLKLPNANSAEVVVIGWRTSQADPSGFASLLLATVHTGDLRYAGRVGTGFSARDRTMIRTELSRIERKTPPVPDVPASEARDVHWVTARRVAEIAYREFTPDGRFRHPSWRGWRPDKSVKDVNPPGA